MKVCMLSLLFCPWPCRSTIEASDVLFYAVVSLIVGVIIGYYWGRGARQTAGPR